MMKKILVVVLFLFVATVAQAADRATVVLIGGAGSDPLYWEFFQKNIPGAIIVIPEQLWPFGEAAAGTWRQIQESGVAVDGKLILVGHSFGGLVSRRVAAEHPEKVIAVVTISSPSGGFWACPKWIFRPGDEDSSVPLYVIMGYKEGLEKWFFRGSSDGTVDVVSALDIGEKRKVTDSIVLAGLDHMEVLQSETVVGIINRWIESRIIHTDQMIASATGRIREMEGIAH